MNDFEKNNYEISNSPAIEEPSRYLQILHKGKELAKLASPYHKICSSVLEILQKKVNKIMYLSFDNQPIQD